MRFMHNYYDFKANRKCFMAKKPDRMERKKKTISTELNKSNSIQKHYERNKNGFH